MYKAVYCELNQTGIYYSPNTVEIIQYALKGQRGCVISSDNGSRGRAKSPKVPKCLQERNPARRPGGPARVRHAHTHRYFFSKKVSKSHYLYKT